jgi:hypothetical protein
MKEVNHMFFTATLRSGPWFLPSKTALYTTCSTCLVKRTVNAYDNSRMKQRLVMCISAVCRVEWKVEHLDV